MNFCIASYIVIYTNDLSNHEYEIAHPTRSNNNQAEYTVFQNIGNKIKTCILQIT